MISGHKSRWMAEHSRPVCCTTHGYGNNTNNIWRGGAYSMLPRAGIGSGYDFVSEFALDILHAFGLKKGVRARYKRERSNRLYTN